MGKFLPFNLIFWIWLGAVPLASALDEADREQLHMLRDWYPVQACRTDRELGQCFKWTERDCQAEALKSLDACLQRHKRQLRGSASGDLEFWQRRILICTFGDLRAKNPKQRLDGAPCEISGDEQ